MHWIAFAALWISTALGCGIILGKSIALANKAGR